MNSSGGKVNFINTLKKLAEIHVTSLTPPLHSTCTDHKKNKTQNCNLTIIFQSENVRKWKNAKTAMKSETESHQ